jgi:hypothetical protein
MNSPALIWPAPRRSNASPYKRYAAPWALARSRKMSPTFLVGETISFDISWALPGLDLRG